MASKKISEHEEAPEAEKVAVSSSLCGHVNRHHYGTDGKPDPITCDLEPGHSGDHHAKFMKNVGVSVTNEKGQVVRVDYHPEEAEGFWGNMANTPVEEIREGSITQMSLLQKDLVLQIMAKNPRMKVEEAFAQARLLPQWNAAELS